MIHESQDTVTAGMIFKGAAGSVFAFGGLAISILSDIEIILRISSLAIGVAVGLITLRNLLKKNKKS